MADSAVCAGLWADHFLPDGMGDLGAAETRSLVVFLAAAHDWGKATPVFAHQIPALSERVRDAGLPIQDDLSGRRNTHALFSATIFLAHADSKPIPRVHSLPIAAVLAGHHGHFPNLSDLSDAMDRLARHPDAWRQVQRDLVEYAFAVAGTTLDAVIQSVQRLRKPDFVRLTAVVIMADWTASNIDDFPIARHEDEIADPRPADERALDAWARMRLPAPWIPSREPLRTAGFASRFELPGTAKPRPIQLAMARAAEESADFLLLEAPMGSGKTEAALLAAESMAANHGRRGLAVLLPTMATSDAMFDRLMSWLRTAGGGDAASVFLAHSRRGQNSLYESIVRSSRAHRFDESGAVTVAALSKRKTGMLSDFVVGTIDQLLMSTLASRHVVLRHLALSSKVVVIDEVHAASVYMAEFLDRALEWLGRYGVPTILLSATLPPARRAELLGAYSAGATSRGGSSRTPETTVSDDDVDAYPRVTVFAGGTTTMVAPEPDGRVSDVEVQRIDDDDESLIVLLTEALAGGGCAVVIRNTVPRCIATAEFLIADGRLDAEIVVAHARFTAGDRAANDARLLELFGDTARGAHGESVRPWTDGRPRVVVATSVVEQSLDIDFDLMVSDIAPVDQLLQRVGRLHRHTRVRPLRVRAPRCYIAGVVSWEELPPRMDRGSVAVHGRYHLLASLAVLQPHLNGAPVRLPDDIPRLVREAWQDDILAPPGWEADFADARRKQLAHIASRRALARSYLVPSPARDARGSLFGFASITAEGAAGSERVAEQAALGRVRDGEQTIEVFLLSEQADGTLRPVATSVADTVLYPHHCPSFTAVRAIEKSVIRLPPALSSDAVVRELESRYRFVAWDESPLVRGELILVLDADLCGRLGDWNLRYDSLLGLVTTPSKEVSV